MVRFLNYGFNLELSGLCVQSSHKKRLKQLLNELKTIASNKKSVSLSALQISNQVQSFVILNRQHLVNNQWNSYNRAKPTNYRGIFNCQIKDFSLQRSADWQHCCSYPGLRMKIERANSIKIRYMDENLDFQDDQVVGFQARVFQHEVDHFQGKDYLKYALDIEITDSELRKNHQQELRQLFERYLNEIKHENKSEPQTFNKLRQFITYSIIDKARQR